jgi:hypothetical protein
MPIPYYLLAKKSETQPFGRPELSAMSNRFKIQADSPSGEPIA